MDEQYVNTYYQKTGIAKQSRSLKVSKYHAALIYVLV